MRRSGAWSVLDLGVRAAEERPDLAPGDLFDRLAELARRGVLEERPRVAQPLVLAELDQVALSQRERVFQEHDERLRTGQYVRALLGIRPNWSL